jgi:hypothetical protein
MVPGICAQLILTDGDAVEVGKPLTLRHTQTLDPRGQVVTGIYWSDGASHEPPHWEVHTLPPVLAGLLKGGDMEIALRSVKLLLAFQTPGISEQDKLKAREDAYKDLPEERHEELVGFVQKLAQAQEELKAQGTLGGVFYLPDHRVKIVHRIVQLQESLDLMMLRKNLEESTRNPSLDDDEDEEEAPAAAPAAPGT